MITIDVTKDGGKWHARARQSVDRRAVEAQGGTEGQVVQRIYDELAALGCQSLVKIRGGERWYPIMAVKAGRIVGSNLR